MQPPWARGLLAGPERRLDRLFLGVRLLGGGRLGGRLWLDDAAVERLLRPVGVDGLGDGAADAGDRCQLVDARQADALDAAEVTQQLALAARADAGDVG